MLLRGIKFMIPRFIMLPELLGTVGLWLAIPVAEVLTLVTIFITSRRSTLLKQ